MIRFTCPNCKKLSDVDDALAGTTYQCPACGKLLRLPAAAAPPPIAEAPRPNPAAIAPASSPPMPRAEEHLPPPPLERPERSVALSRSNWKMPGRLTLALLGGGGLLALLLVGCLFWWFLSGSGLSNEVTYLPENFDYIASVNVSTVLASDVYQSLKKEVDDTHPDVDKEFKKLEKEFGLPLSDIGRVTVAGLLPRPAAQSAPEFMVVIKPRKAVEIGDLFKGQQFGKFEESKVGSFTMREFMGGQLAVCVPDGRTILLSTKDTLGRVLRREKRAEVSPGLQEAMKKADFSQAVTVAVGYQDLWKELLKDKDVRQGITRSFDYAIDPDKLLPLLETTVLHVRIGPKLEVSGEILGKDSKATLTVSVKKEALLGLLNKGDRTKAQKEDDRPEKEMVARAQIDVLIRAVQSYQVKNGVAPTSLNQLLEADKGGPYLQNGEALMDPWNNPYRYNPQAVNATGALEPEVWTISPKERRISSMKR